MRRNREYHQDLDSDYNYSDDMMQLSDTESDLEEDQYIKTDEEDDPHYKEVDGAFYVISNPPPFPEELQNHVVKIPPPVMVDFSLIQNQMVPEKFTKPLLRPQSQRQLSIKQIQTYTKISKKVSSTGAMKEFVREIDGAMYYIPNPPEFPDVLKKHLIGIDPPKLDNDIKAERFGISSTLLRMEGSVPMNQYKV